MNTIIEKNAVIVLHIKDVMIEKNINRNKLSNMTGIKYDIVTKYYNGECYQIDLANLAKICVALKCDINDILKLIDYDNEIK